VYHDVIVYGGIMVIIGGRCDGWEDCNDVWISENGGNSWVRDNDDV